MKNLNPFSKRSTRVATRAQTDNRHWIKLAIFSLAILSALVVLTKPSTAADPVDLMWDDLQPASNNLLNQFQDTDPGDPLGHQGNTPAQQQLSPAGAVVPELDGTRIRIPAFVVPLDGDNKSLSEMLLVPYFGACIHVPPPPPNQIIYINSDEAVNITKIDLYQPVWATGTIKTDSLQHELAQIGYQMEIEKLTPYDWRAAEEARKQAELNRN